MKRALIFVAGGGLLFLVGFFSGRAFQHTATGYHYRLLEQKEYASSLGPIQWSCFLESVGAPFLDPEKTMITLGNRTIYKAQRDFQDDDPRARNIEVSGDSIKWADGDFRYHLTVKPITIGERAGPANGSQPFTAQTNATSSAAGSHR